ncbi:hypothetical protein POVCU2_0020490 [Plasmodium ovale curtisi]|uniref:Uncharacterized protein n=1 Tax=Plasmodium ovale curtisi TaxID=864141 RepID=A0A1A8X9S1_PLAOA|nr:hypothetical protein POVCU2_0020490 [Plasmodium ovale curtisi]SBT00576.1 hypothetical protein POVCU1_060950 [Plasmodium ovale curtisi]
MWLQNIRVSKGGTPIDLICELLMISFPLGTYRYNVVPRLRKGKANWGKSKRENGEKTNNPNVVDELSLFFQKIDSFEIKIKKKGSVYLPLHMHNTYPFINERKKRQLARILQNRKKGSKIKRQKASQKGVCYGYAYGRSISEVTDRRNNEIVNRRSCHVAEELNCIPAS